MRLATSCYQAAERIAASGLAPVRITLGAPRWKLPYRLAGTVTVLAPTRAIFALKDSAGFEAAYRAHLDQAGTAAVVAELERVAADNPGTPGLVLLCFEDVERLGDSACHRRMFARWWEEATGQAVPELVDDVPSLF